MGDRIAELSAELADMDAKRALIEKELSELKIKNIGKLENQKANEADARLKKSSKQFITAASARLQAETTVAVRNHIAKFIQEEAKEGRTRLDFGTWGICDAQINGIVDELRALGYEVDSQSEPDTLIIKW